VTGVRAAVVGLAVAALCATAAAFLTGFGAVSLFPPALWLLLLLVALLFERYRYKPLVEAPPGPDWADTGERFRDPRTGREVRVFSQPATGRRAYVSPASSRRGKGWNAALTR
jgi:hypothetical protein